MMNNVRNNSESTMLQLTALSVSMLKQKVIAYIKNTIPELLAIIIFLLQAFLKLTTDL